MPLTPPYMTISISCANNPFQGQPHWHRWFQVQTKTLKVMVVIVIECEVNTLALVLETGCNNSNTTTFKAQSFYAQPCSWLPFVTKLIDHLQTLCRQIRSCGKTSETTLAKGLTDGMSILLDVSTQTRVIINYKNWHTQFGRENDSM